MELFHNLADADLKVTIFKRHYNEIRPHSSLGYVPPAKFSQIPAPVRATPSLDVDFGMS